MTVRLEDLKTMILNLGYVGENEHRQIRFDCKKMFDEYPHASASLTVAPAEGESYPAIIERDGEIVTWTITDSDLTAEGDGELQLSFTNGETVAKTFIGRCRVCRSIVPTGEIPSGIDDFITRAGTLLDQVEDTFPAGGTTGQVLAKKSDADYDTEWVPQGGGGTEDYDELENRPQIGGVTLTGNKSLHDLGAAAESDIPDVSGLYTKPASGIPASDIADGVIPDPEDLIDDTAGEGDTDKVWSADKSHELLTEINSKLDAPETAGTEGQILVSDGEGGQTWEDNKGITQAIKTAILDCFAHVAWIGDAGQTYYEALEDAFSGGGTKTLVSISAVYTQGIVYPEDSLDVLKSSLVITGTYDDTSTATITEYTLSGTLAVGSSTVTVTVDNITTTFTVDVYGFKPMRCVTMRGSVGSNAYTDDNNSRCLSLCDVGSHKLKDSHGTLLSYYPVPIRSGVSVLKVSVGNDLDTTIQIVQWDSTLNDWKRIYGTDWGFKPSQYSLSAYNDGTYACAIVAAKDSGTPGLPDNTYNFTNHVFSAYDIHFE